MSRRQEGLGARVVVDEVDDVLAVVGAGAEELAGKERELRGELVDIEFQPAARVSLP